MGREQNKTRINGGGRLPTLVDLLHNVAPGRGKCRRERKLVQTPSEEEGPRCREVCKV